MEIRLLHAVKNENNIISYDFYLDDNSYSLSYIFFDILRNDEYKDYVLGRISKFGYFRDFNYLIICTDIEVIGALYKSYFKNLEIYKQLHRERMLKGILNES